MTQRPPPTAVIFDLDGTLVQTRISSWEIFRRVSDEFSLGIEDPEDYFALFNDNLYASLRAICNDDDQVRQVKASLLRRLGEDYTPALVPGIAAVVRTLASSCTLAVMSSNSVEVVRRILDGNGLAFCFAHVFGGDVVESKRDAIQAMVADADYGIGRRCQGSYDEDGDSSAPELGTTVLVTDTAGDIREATAAGIRAVGVAWGMHTVEDLEQAGAEFVALWPQEITARLFENGAPAPTGACALPPVRPSVRPAPDQTARTACASCPCGGRCAGAVEAPAARALDDVVAAAGQRHDRRRQAASRLGQTSGGGPAPHRTRGASRDLASAVAAICP